MPGPPISKDAPTAADAHSSSYYYVQHTRCASVLPSTQSNGKLLM